MALGMILRAFHYRSREVLIPLYKTFVRPKLEHAVAAWSPWTESDRETLERVQRRLVRLVSDKKGGNYKERLESIGLTTLTERRERGDVIETFKTINGFNKVDRSEWFNFRNAENTRATRSTVSVSEDGECDRSDVLYMGTVRLDTRKQFFTVRAISMWNNIPDEVKSKKSVNSFKNAYDEWKRKERQQQQ